MRIPEDNRPTGPVFFDPTRRRARAVRAAAAALAALGVLWVALFGISVYVLGAAPPGRALDELREEGAPLFADAMPAGTALGLPPEDLTGSFMCSGVPLAGADPLSRDPGLSVDVVLRAWPESAVAALADNCAGLPAIEAEWYRVAVPDGRLERIVPAFSSDAALRAQLGRRSDLIAIRPIVQLVLPFGPERERLLDPDQRNALVADLTNTVARNGYDGLCLNPLGLRPWHVPGLKAFLAALAPNLHALGAESCIVAEADGPLWRDAGLVETVDEVLLQAFRVPDPGDGPAPLAPEPWVETTVAEAVDRVGTGKLRVAIGAFGYLWPGQDAPPREIGFGEAMELAARHDAEIAFPEDAGNTRVTFTAGSGIAQTAWLLDAASFWNALRILEDLGVRKASLWASGLEDPGVWPLVRQDGGATVARIEDVALDHHVGYAGAGPFLRVASVAEEGLRKFWIDPETGRITGLRFTRVPRPVSMIRYGRLPEKLVALTFDDGPDEAYTASVLDALRDEGITGTFFVVGANVARTPDLARRIVAEGHELGSHTYFHPDTSAISDYRLAFELNALQRLLASVTGRGAVLFRSPYGRSEGPVTAAEALPLVDILDQGYIVAGADVVPRDWEGLSPEEIVGQVMDEIRGTAPGSKVIVMHDAGGDRSATAAALPLLIARLRDEGYGFTSLGGLLGMSRDALMPPQQDAMTWFDSASFRVLSGLGEALAWLFWVAVLVGLVRSLAVLGLALLRRPHVADGAGQTTVTVVVPAFNEEASIERVVRQILASDHDRMSVLVVDDGSEDRTAEIVEDLFGDDDRVTLVSQRNQGKWQALNTAYRLVDTDVVVAVDADAVLRPDAVRLLAAHFADPRVGAVAGNVKVANRVSLLTRLQSLEYITAQNVDRRAAEVLNAMLVVPGAIGAWRTAAVREAGLYSNDTITEDADLTVSVLRQGYRAVFEPRAVSYTEAPQTLRAFLRQRLRWTFGMMQTAWKHRRAARDRHPVGLVAIPDLWLAGVAQGLLAPVADLVFLGVLFDLGVDLAVGAPVLDRTVSLAMVAGYLALPAIDVLAILVALGFERVEPLRLVLLVPFQRLVYRPLLYLTLYRAVARALRGTLAGWGTSIRFGTLRTPRA